MSFHKINGTFYSYFLLSKDYVINISFLSLLFKIKLSDIDVTSSDIDVNFITPTSY